MNKLRFFKCSGKQRYEIERKGEWPTKIYGVLEMTYDEWGFRPYYTEGINEWVPTQQEMLEIQDKLAALRKSPQA